MTLLQLACNAMGFPRLLVVDADTKFMAVFTTMCKFLTIKLHTLSKGNHKGQLVERFNKYLNKAVKIALNDRSDNKSWVEAALLSIYAWNSAPITNTDIVRSVVAFGRHFPFPIDINQDELNDVKDIPAQHAALPIKFLLSMKYQTNYNRILLSLLNEERRRNS